MRNVAKTTEQRILEARATRKKNAKRRRAEKEAGAEAANEIINMIFDQAIGVTPEDIKDVGEELDKLNKEIFS